MNESSTEKRGRRRAMRSAGPPVDGASETTRIVEEVPLKFDAKAAPPAAEATEKIDAPPTVKMDAEPVAPEPVSDAEPVADEPEGPGAERDSRGLGWLGWAAAAIAVLSALVLIGSGGLFFYHQRHQDALDQRRADYTQTAKQTVLNLTNIKDDTAQADIDRVLAVASGQLKEEYSSRKDAYAQVVQQAKVKASGEIIETAIESEDDNSARVLVAAKQTLTNAASADPQQRYYRFRITVTHGDDGRLTASQVEFVP
ncbi:hypothetical protein ACFYTQ_30190 [Nocardia sp. NPDC004068]|uniref:hypothetical protein n=1 Tax=Nocardia sp. NPDC004068 TaxID=3364303 RepID=UPI0036BFEB5C